MIAGIHHKRPLGQQFRIGVIIATQAAVERINTRSEFCRRKRLCDIVIRSGHKSGNLVHLLRPGGQHNDAHLLIRCTYLTCYFYLADRGKAEDVVQDVFVRLMTTNPTLQPGKEKAWLLKVAMNRCRDLWRGAWLKRVVLGGPAFELIPAPDEFAKIGEKQEMMNAINRLPAMFKEVILLHYYQGYSITDIAEMMELPEGTISSRLSRARKKLEEVILKGGEEP